MDEKANGGNWRPEWISAVWIRTVPFFREFSPFVFEKIPLDSSKTRCFFFLPAADWLTPQRTELREKCHVPTSDVDLLTGFDPVTTGFSPLPRAAATSRDTLLVADARVDRQIVMAAIARHIVAPRAAAPAPTGARAARARPSACPPPGRPPPSLSALAAARRWPPPRCVHRATTRVVRDPRLLSPLASRVVSQRASCSRSPVPSDPTLASPSLHTRARRSRSRSI